MPNDTIHEEIESWLAADVHDQLSSEERTVFEQHLAACASCRALQQEEKQMHQLLENTLATESADPAFEQRMISRFRDKIPAPNGGLLAFFANLMRMRAAQITAVAALLLTLVQVGKMVTGEHREVVRTRSAVALAPPPARDKKSADAEGNVAVNASVLPRAEEGARQAKDYRTTDALAAGAPEELKKSLADKSEAPPASSSIDEVREKESDRPDAARTNQAESPPVPAPVTPADSRKLIRNAQLELQVANYDAAVERLTSIASEE
jgi:hypothetical protein